MQTRIINDYELSNFSQNGEDGIIEFLASKLIKNNKFFVELGCSYGLENNSTNLILNGWSGVGCDIPINIKYFMRLLKIIKPSGEVNLAGGKIDLNNINQIINQIINKTIKWERNLMGIQNFHLM